MSFTIFTGNTIQNSNLINNTLSTFLNVSSSKVNMYGSLGIGTNILFQKLHIDNVSFGMDIKISNENKIKSYTYNTYYALLPIGSIIVFPSSTTTYYNMMINNGWIECDGRSVTILNYPLLEPLLRNSAYDNNGPYPQTIFNVPNFKDRIPIGAGGTLTQNNINTLYTNNITINQIPPHKHNIQLNSSLGNNNSSHTHGNVTLLNDTNNYVGESRFISSAPGASTVYPNNTDEAIGTNNHNHNVMLDSGTNLVNNPINLRHNVMYILYFIKGR